MNSKMIFPTAVQIWFTARFSTIIRSHWNILWRHIVLKRSLHWSHHESIAFHIYQMSYLQYLDPKLFTLALMHCKSIASSISSKIQRFCRQFSIFYTSWNPEIITQTALHTIYSSEIAFQKSPVTSCVIGRHLNDHKSRRQYVYLVLCTNIIIIHCRNKPLFLSLKQYGHIQAHRSLF